MLSWRDVEQAGTSADWAYNVAIHEFVHVIDMRNGAADGVPPLPDEAAHANWVRVMGDEYRAFCQHTAAGWDTLLDPYGAQSIDEFFAVASEAFFVAPEALRSEHPALYSLLAGFFRQDPALFHSKL
jgi:Mlc titration factor MtfA (ptsG expression regulator)